MSGFVSQLVNQLVHFYFSATSHGVVQHSSTTPDSTNRLLDKSIFIRTVSFCTTKTDDFRRRPKNVNKPKNEDNLKNEN